MKIQVRHSGNVQILSNSLLAFLLLNGMLPDSNTTKLWKIFTFLLNHLKYIKAEWISSHYSIHGNEVANGIVQILIREIVNSVR